MKLLIEEKLKEDGRSKSFIAKKLKVNHNTITNWINGRTPIPFWAMVEISKILNCSLYDLFEE